MTCPVLVDIYIQPFSLTDHRGKHIYILHVLHLYSMYKSQCCFLLVKYTICCSCDEGRPSGETLQSHSENKNKTNKNWEQQFVSLQRDWAQSRNENSDTSLIPGFPNTVKIKALSLLDYRLQRFIMVNSSKSIKTYPLANQQCTSTASMVESISEKINSFKIDDQIAVTIVSLTRKTRQVFFHHNTNT